jgi:hypothetical protein
MIRPLFTALAIGLTTLIIWAALSASFSQSFGLIIADPWGIVTLVDLYLGFIVISVVIYAIEPDKRIAWAMIVPLYFLGNIVTAGWLAWRGAGWLKRQH